MSSLALLSTPAVIPTSPPPGAPLLQPGLQLTLRPMRYPRFFEMYRAAIKNTWTVEEVDFSTDLGDLRERMSPADRSTGGRAAYAAAKVSSPADSSDSSKATSPSWRPVSSKAAIWNGPSTVPRSGMTTCQGRMVPLKT